MPFFTGKGDDGSTGFFGTKRRLTKDAALPEALGTVDELNSFLGIIRSLPDTATITLQVEKNKISIANLVEQLQQDLFIVQAELANMDTPDKKITQEKVAYLEHIADAVEAHIPPIKHFVIPGATTLSAHFDYARAVARRTERRVVTLSKTTAVRQPLLAYLNRLSSTLYALARLAAHDAGKKEKPPSYS